MSGNSKSILSVPADMPRISVGAQQPWEDPIVIGITVGAILVITGGICLTAYWCCKDDKGSVKWPWK